MTKEIITEITTTASEITTNSCLLTPSFQQIPYNEIIKRIDAGNRGLHELLIILQEERELKEKNVLFASKASRSNIFEFEITDSSCERMIGFFKNFHLFLSKAQVNHLKSLSEIIIKLEDLKSHRIVISNKHKQAVSKCLKDISICEENLEKAKKNYIKIKHEFQHITERLQATEIIIKEEKEKNISNIFDSSSSTTTAAAASTTTAAAASTATTSNNHHGHLMTTSVPNSMSTTNKFSMGRMLSAFDTNPEQEKEKQLKKLEKKRHEMANSYSIILLKKKLLLENISILDTKMEEACKALQHSEIQRMSLLKTFITKYCNSERKEMEIRSEQLNILEESINLLEPKNDINLFISQKKHLELTHKYCHALKLLDVYYYQRYGIPKDLIGLEQQYSILPSHESIFMEQLSTSEGMGQTYETKPLNSSISYNKEEIKSNEIDEDYIIKSNSNSRTPSKHDTSSLIDVHILQQPEADPLLGLRLTAEEGFKNCSTDADFQRNLENFDEHEENNEDIDKVEELKEDYFVTKSDKTSNDVQQKQQKPRLSRRGSHELQQIYRMSVALMALFSPITETNNDSINNESIELTIDNEPSKKESKISEAAKSAMTKTVEADSYVNQDNESNYIPMEGYEAVDEIDTRDLENDHIVDKETWRIMIESKPARELFLQELDEQRARRAFLSNTCYESMANAMTAFLDYCDVHGDAQSAMRISNMANTFHKIADVPCRSSDDKISKSPSSSTKETTNSTIDDIHHTRNISTTKDVKSSPREKQRMSSGEKDLWTVAMEAHKVDDLDPEEHRTPPRPVDARKLTSCVVPPDERQYIYSDERIKRHQIWRKKGFWETALENGIFSHLELTTVGSNGNGGSHPVLWDELHSDAMREAVVNVHNIIFGQLGILAFSMREVGLSHQEVEENILSMALKAQLAEEQVQELVKNVRNEFSCGNNSEVIDVASEKLETTDLIDSSQDNPSSINTATSVTQRHIENDQSISNTASIIVVTPPSKSLQGIETLSTPRRSEAVIDTESLASHDTNEFVIRNNSNEKGTIPCDVTPIKINHNKEDTSTVAVAEASVQDINEATIETLPMEKNMDKKNYSTMFASYFSFQSSSKTSRSNNKQRQHDNQKDGNSDNINEDEIIIDRSSIIGTEMQSFKSSISRQSGSELTMINELDGDEETSIKDSTAKNSSLWPLSKFSNTRSSSGNNNKIHASSISDTADDGEDLFAVL